MYGFKIAKISFSSYSPTLTAIQRKCEVSRRKLHLTKRYKTILKEIWNIFSGHKEIIKSVLFVCAYAFARIASFDIYVWMYICQKKKICASRRCKKNKMHRDALVPGVLRILKHWGPLYLGQLEKKRQFVQLLQNQEGQWNRRFPQHQSGRSRLRCWSNFPKIKTKIQIRPLYLLWAAMRRNRAVTRICILICVLTFTMLSPYTVIKEVPVNGLHIGSMRKIWEGKIQNHQKMKFRGLKECAHLIHDEGGIIWRILLSIRCDAESKWLTLLIK